MRWALALFRSPAACALVLVLLVALAHFPALGNGYVLDDSALLVGNPFVRTPEGLWQLLSKELFLASGEYRNVPYYRPLSGALYWLSYQLVGDSAWLQHSINLLLHGAVSATLFMLLARWNVSVGIAFTFAAIFAVHPVTPDIVAYIGGRQDMLGWSFLLLGLIALGTRRRSIELVAISAVATALSSLCREFFFCAPLLLLPAALVHPTGALRRASCIVIGAATALGGVLSLRNLVDVQSFAVTIPRIGELTSISGAVTSRLIKLIFLPLDVSVDLTVTPIPLWQSLSVLLLLMMTTAVSVGWLARRAQQRLSPAVFGWAALWSSALMHVPVAVKYGTISDRYGYGAVLGFTALAAPLARTTAERWRNPLRPQLRQVIAALVVCAPIPLTWSRSLEWRSEASLQRAMYRAHPDDPQAQFAEGMRHFSLGNFDRAFELCSAYSQHPQSGDRAGYCLGAIYLMRGQPARAAAELEPFTFARPGKVHARILLFRAWFRAGDLEGVRRGLDYFQAMYPQAPDIKQAAAELERRERERARSP